MVGTSLGHFQIDARLGAGGMGVVYRAHDAKLLRPVAIKLLTRPSSADAPDGLLQEARSACALNHPNVCTIYEVGEADGQTYIAMEYVEGNSLKEVIGATGLPFDQFVEYAVQLAEAIAHAHDRGLVHRDVKAANVMLSDEGKIKVLDFGLAVRLRDTDIDTLTQHTLTSDVPGPLIGTLPYMAPELLRAESATKQTDVWAMGVLLFEMACGALPFRGKTGFSLWADILHAPPAALPPTVPATLRAIIQRCLHKDPERRYHGGEEVRATLATMRSGVLPGTPAVPPAPRTGGPSVVVLPFNNHSPESGDDYFGDGLTEEVIADLSGVRGLRVVSHTSSMQLKGTTRPIKDIAADLDVQYALEGSVRKSGSEFKVTARLIDTSSDCPIWGHKYGGALENVFAIQETLSRSIVEALTLTMTTEEEQARRSSDSRRAGLRLLLEGATGDAAFLERRTGAGRAVSSREHAARQRQRVAHVGDGPTVLAIRQRRPVDRYGLSEARRGLRPEHPDEGSAVGPRSSPGRARARPPGRCAGGGATPQARRLAGRDRCGHDDVAVPFVYAGRSVRGGRAAGAPRRRAGPAHTALPGVAGHGRHRGRALRGGTSQGLNVTRRSTGTTLGSGSCTGRRSF